MFNRAHKQKLINALLVVRDAPHFIKRYVTAVLRLNVSVYLSAEVLVSSSFMCAVVCVGVEAGILWSVQQRFPRI